MMSIEFACFLKDVGNPDRRFTHTSKVTSSLALDTRHQEPKSATASPSGTGPSRLTGKVGLDSRSLQMCSMLTLPGTGQQWGRLTAPCHSLPSSQLVFVFVQTHTRQPLPEIGARCFLGQCVAEAAAHVNFCKDWL